MIRAIAVEYHKIRRRKIWAIVAALIIVQILWSLWGVWRMDTHDLSQGWMHFLYKFPLLNAIMMPVITAVVASRLSDIEHKGQTLKLLETVMPSGRLFAAKFICGALYLIAAVLMQLIVIVIVGYAFGFEGAPPIDKLFFYFIFTTALNLTLLLLQQVLSLLIVNQLVPLAIGIVGSFAGLFIMYFPQNLSRFILWGYYGVLMLVGMNWDSTTRIADLYYTPINWTDPLVLAGMFCAIYAVGRALFVRKEM